MLTGANELRDLRLLISLPAQFVQKRVPDVVPRHLVLLAWRRPAEAALRQFRDEVRVGRE
jgi:hypothetical protein